MKLSVHIVTKGRLKLLRRCLESVLADLPSQSEVIVVINGIHPNVEEYLSQISVGILRWKVTSKSTLTRCRNDAFLECQGEFIFCLDDDVEVDRGYFQRILEAFHANPDVAVMGGPNLTPPQSHRFQRLVGAVMTSVFAAPMVRRRYGGGNQKRGIADERDLIFCNLCIRKSFIPSQVRFREHLIANEENVFLYEMGRFGLKAFFLPSGYVYHWRRETLTGFFLQIFHYGRGRAQQFAMRPKSCHPSFFVPSLTIGVGLGLVLNPSGWAWLGSLALLHQGLAYLSALGSKEVRKLGFVATLSAAPLTALVHLGYGLGFWDMLVRSLGRTFLERFGLGVVFPTWSDSR